MTDKEITAKAREIVLGEIANVSSDTMGLGELLDERLDGLTEVEQEALTERLGGELDRIAEELRAQWGMS